MKYTNTSRTLSLIFHTLIFLAFGAMGVYFGLAVAPCYFSNSALETISAPYNLYSELGMVGLTLATISMYGIVNAVKSLQNPRDDAPVIKCFNAFIVEGYIAAIFCLLNGVVYFDAIRGGDSTSGKALGFLIVLMILLFIGLMIATNIPMVKLYDRKDQTPLLASFGVAAGVFFGWAAIVTLGTLIGSWTQGIVAWSHVINGQLAAFLVIYIANAALLITSGIFVKKGGNVQTKIAGYFTSLAGMLTSFCFITNGVIGLVYGKNSGNSLAVHLQGIEHKIPASGDAFAIICLVVGAMLFVGSIVFAGMHGTGKIFKKKLAK